MKFIYGFIEDQENQDIQELAELMSSTSSLSKISIQLFNDKTYQDQVIQALKYQSIVEMNKSNEQLKFYNIINCEKSQNIIGQYAQISKDARLSKLRYMVQTEPQQVKKQMQQIFYSIHIGKNQFFITTMFKIVYHGIRMFLKNLKKQITRKMRRLNKKDKKTLNLTDRIKQRLLQLGQKIKHIWHKIWYMK